MTTRLGALTVHEDRERFRQALARIAKRSCACGEMARHVLAHRGETPGGHWRRCRDCAHVAICADCLKVRGFCAAHREDPETSYIWTDVRTGS